MKWKKSQDNWPHFYPSKSELYSVYCIILYSPSCKPLFTKVFVLVALLYTISFFPFSLYLVCLKFFRLQVLFSFCFSEQFDFSFSLLLKLFCWCPASWSEQQWPLWKQTIFQSLLGKEQIEKQYPISSENVWVFSPAELPSKEMEHFFPFPVSQCVIFFHSCHMQPELHCISEGFHIIHKENKQIQ